MMWLLVLRSCDTERVVRDMVVDVGVVRYRVGGG